MIIIGRKDRIDLPDIGLKNIEAKIDTGAYGCVLHCHDYQLKKRGGKDVLTYKLLDPSHPKYKDKTLFSEDFSQKSVKSSNGQLEIRYTIKTQILIFNKRFKIEFSLTDRKEMKNPILLGRKFLSKRFLVDVNARDVSYKQKRTYS